MTNQVIVKVILALLATVAVALANVQYTEGLGALYICLILICMAKYCAAASSLSGHNRNRQPEECQNRSSKF